MTGFPPANQNGRRLVETPAPARPELDLRMADAAAFVARRQAYVERREAIERAELDVAAEALGQGEGDCTPPWRDFAASAEADMAEPRNPFASDITFSRVETILLVTIALGGAFGLWMGLR